MAPAERKDGDALKLYTVVMAVLVIVMGILYFVIDGKRKDFEAANVRVERYMTGKGMPLQPEGKPQNFSQLALAVERLSKDLADATGGEGMDGGHISKAFLEQQATNSGLTQTWASRERSTPGGQGKYETLTSRIDYGSSGSGPVAVWQLLRLMYLIEGQRRLYRVSEVSWQVADRKDNPEPPFDRIKNPKIEVSLRFPKVGN